jgi:hypothetical protein
MQEKLRELYTAMIHILPLVNYHVVMESGSRCGGVWKKITSGED